MTDYESILKEDRKLKNCPNCGAIMDGKNGEPK